MILVHESNWPAGASEGRHTIPFLEANGDYAGIPPDDDTAIREFELIARIRTDFIVFADPARGGSATFRDLTAICDESFVASGEHDRLIAFDLHQG